MQKLGTGNQVAIKTKQKREGGEGNHDERGQTRTRMSLASSLSSLVEKA